MGSFTFRLVCPFTFSGNNSELPLFQPEHELHSLFPLKSFSPNQEPIILERTYWFMRPSKEYNLKCLLAFPSTTSGLCRINYQLQLLLKISGNFIDTLILMEGVLAVSRFLCRYLSVLTVICFADLSVYFSQVRNFG